MDRGQSIPFTLRVLGECRKEFTNYNTPSSTSPPSSGVIRIIAMNRISGDDLQISAHYNICSVHVFKKQAQSPMYS